MKRRSEEVDLPKPKTLYTLTLDAEQIKKLQKWCDRQLWVPFEVEYAAFAFKGDGVNVVAYKSGKIVIQGKKTEDFVTYVLEAEITHTPQLGYDEVNHPEWFEAHAGLDESGKGDLFGPLVTACVIADKTIVNHWIQKGMRESKRVTSDAAVFALEKIILETEGVVTEKLSFSMPKYNELYTKFGSNLNKLLAWMHARTVENALAKRHVPWGMLDQFTKAPLVQRQLKANDFDLRMQTKAESDPVVAAASIIARAEYLRKLKALSKNCGENLLKGASAKTREQAGALVKKYGAEALQNYAKVHFKTANEAIADNM